jgi:hypothetical protein
MTDPSLNTESAGRHAPVDMNAAPSEVATALLDALSRMALRSYRRQADLHFAIRAAGLGTSPEAAGAALIELQRLGFVSDVLELTDGGVLLVVSADGFAWLKAARQKPAAALRVAA